MKIKRIELCNFGSYSGTNTFDIPEGKRKNIVLIGGKNGAGKTTLFSGIKLCLYGFRAVGFLNINGYYRREVKKYFNDLARYDSEPLCYVEIEFLVSNGQMEDCYVMRRNWDINAPSLNEFETLFVSKNGKKLHEDEIEDFCNFILAYIPPELFDLFFFDGEQIADYFLDDEGNKRIKNAFMILCGYDTFDIIESNFKRLCTIKNGTENTGTYISAKDNVNNINELLTKEKAVLHIKQEEYDTTSAAIMDLDKKYKLSGGVLYKEWNDKFLQLKEEERKRDENNSLLKSLANDEVPFIIARDILVKLLSRDKWLCDF